MNMWPDFTDTARPESAVCGTAVSLNERLVLLNDTAGAAAIPFIECPRHVVSAVELSGGIDRQALTNSVATILQRNAVLRSCFTQPDRRALLPVTALATTQLDLRNVNASTPGSLDAAISEFVNARFDLVDGPLCRCMLVQLAAHRLVLVFVAHHAVFDGWSRQLFIRELERLYLAGGHESPDGLASAPQYDLYVADQQRRLLGDQLGERIGYWRKELLMSGSEPRLTPDVPVTDVQARYHVARMSPELVARLNQFRRAYRVSLAIALFAAFALMIHRLTGRNRIVIGMTTVDRPSRLFESIIGLCMNALPMVSDVSTNPTFAEMASTASRRFMDVHARRQVPYPLLLTSLGCRDGHDWVPFRIVFNCANTRAPHLNLPGISTRWLPCLAASDSAADLSVHIRPSGEALDVMLMCKSARFAAETIDAWSASFIDVLSGVVERPDEPVGGILEMA